jgi:hypothetical protein
MKKIFRLIIAIAFIIIPAVVTFADPPNPPDPGGGTPGGGGIPVGAPIDGGLSILLAMGAGYGAYKTYNLKKKSKEE